MKLIINTLFLIKGTERPRKGAKLREIIEGGTTPKIQAAHTRRAMLKLQANFAKTSAHELYYFI